MLLNLLPIAILVACRLGMATTFAGLLIYGRYSHRVIGRGNLTKLLVTCSLLVVGEIVASLITRAFVRDKRDSMRGVRFADTFDQFTILVVFSSLAYVGLSSMAVPGVLALVGLATLATRFHPAIGFNHDLRIHTTAFLTQASLAIVLTLGPTYQDYVTTWSRDGMSAFAIVIAVVATALELRRHFRKSPWQGAQY
jgi:hypothetical protein